MVRRRRKKNIPVDGILPEGTPAVVVPGSAITPSVAPGASRETAKASPRLPDAFLAAFEKAADRSRAELASRGKIKPTAFFVHADGTMQAVSLLLKDEHRKEALIKRIREKVLAENTFAVLTVTESGRGHREVVLSGVSPGVRASARVDYSFDDKTKTVTSWKMNWLNQAVRNPFLDGIFDRRG
jgi:hypothetical protein